MFVLSFIWNYNQDIQEVEWIWEFKYGFSTSIVLDTFLEL